MKFVRVNEDSADLDVHGNLIDLKENDLLVVIREWKRSLLVTTKHGNVVKLVRQRIEDGGMSEVCL